MYYGLTCIQNDDEKYGLLFHLSYEQAQRMTELTAFLAFARLEDWYVLGVEAQPRSSVGLYHLLSEAVLVQEMGRNVWEAVQKVTFQTLTRSQWTILRNRAFAVAPRIFVELDDAFWRVKFTHNDVLYVTPELPREIISIAMSGLFGFDVPDMGRLVVKSLKSIGDKVIVELRDGTTLSCRFSDLTPTDAGLLPLQEFRP